MIENPEIHAWTFDRGMTDWYGRMAKVYKQSCENQGLVCHLHQMATPPLLGRASVFADNHLKLQYWTEWVCNAPEGQLLLITDSDMICIRRPPPGYFDSVTGVGLTQRVDAKAKFNAGMICVRVNDESRGFFKTWLEADTLLFENWGIHKPYCERYLGMNQASLGWVMENRPKAMQNVRWFPCHELNLCNHERESWTDSLFTHVKSELRRALMSGKGHNEFRDYWHKIERNPQVLPKLPKSVAGVGRRYRKASRGQQRRDEYRRSKRQRARGVKSVSEHPSSWFYVDVGANCGQTIADWLETHPRSKVLAVEPAAGMAFQIRQRFAGDDRVTVVEAAAGTENGKALFYPGLLSTQSSTLLQGKKGKWKVDYDSPVEVQVRDLTELLDEHWVEGQRMVIKIDVEGFEYQLVPKLVETGWAGWAEEVRVEWHDQKFDIDPAEHLRVVGMLEAVTTVVPWK